MKTCLKHLYDLDAISGVAWLDMDELAEKAASRGLWNGSIQNW